MSLGLWKTPQVERAGVYMSRSSLSAVMVLLTAAALSFSSSISSRCAD
jgi:hypothetical protein